MQFLLWTWTWICRRRQPPVRATQSVPTSTQTVGTQTSYSSTWLPDADTCSLTLPDADTSSSTWSVLPDADTLPEDAPVLPDTDTPTQRMQLPPEPEPDAIVYIAPKAGERWHSFKGCSHAHVPVPYAQAIASVRYATPCKKCLLKKCA